MDALAVVTAREGERLVGVLPLGRTRTDWRGMYFPRVGLFARGDFQPPVVDPRFMSTILPRMLDRGREILGERHGLWWPNLIEGSDALDLIRAYCRDRGMPWVEEREPAPRLQINGRPLAEVEQSWSASHRGDVRRQRRRIEEKGSVTVWEPESFEEAEPILEEFFEVHDGKWLAQGYPGMFANPANRRLYRSALRRLMGRGAHFSILKIGDVNVSYIFGFLVGQWLQIYRPTFRPEFANVSPSKVHLAMLLERGCNQGWRGIDFLLGAEPYKLQWSSSNVEAITLTAGASRVAPSYLWFGTLRPALRDRYAGHFARVKARLQKGLVR